MRKTPVILLLVVLVAASIAGCSNSGEGLTEYYGQRVEWGSCAGFDGSESLSSNIECGRVQVPLDYGTPNGKTAHIAVSRMRARGDRIGSIVVNPGGPGAVGLAKAELGDTALGDRFDVVGFDPRGLGASSPQVECLLREEYQVNRPDDLITDWTSSGLEAAEQRSRDFVAKCVERSGADLLGHVGTREVVRDLDVIRAALGDSKLTYLGYSYGTRIGTMYAEEFPQNIRAMVLDSAADPARPLGEQVSYYERLQKGFDAYAADCAKSDDCPVGVDRTLSSNRLQSLLKPLLSTPAPASDSAVLTYNDAVRAIVATLYRPERWSTITVGLKELTVGRGDTLRGVVDYLSGKMDTALQTAVLCLDDPRIVDRRTAGALQQRMLDVAPFLDSGGFQGEAPLDKCAFWPVQPTSAPHSISVSGLPGIVVVAATGDPAVAYTENQSLARELGASLVTLDAAQHGVFLAGGSSCVDIPVLKYLSELTKPAEGLMCRHEQQ